MIYGIQKDRTDQTKTMQKKNSKYADGAKLLRKNY